jgi:hypothetical protein
MESLLLLGSRLGFPIAGYGSVARFHDDVEVDEKLQRC